MDLCASWLNEYTHISGDQYVRGVQIEKRELIDIVLSTGRAKGQNKVTVSYEEGMPHHDRLD